MKIRKATKKDLKNIGKLMKTEFSKSPFNEKAPMKAVLKSLEFYNKLGKIYVSISNQQIAGVIIFKEELFWEGPVILIEDLAVDERFKKQGIGTDLMNFIEVYAKKKKAKFIGFIAHKKSNAIKFHKKLGYKLKKSTIIMKKEIK